MLLPDDLIRAALRRRRPAPPFAWAYFALLPAVRVRDWRFCCWCLPGARWRRGRVAKCRLARKYRPGQSMVYVTKVSTNSKIDSNPPELKNFFPPMPTNLRMNQQSTVTVSNVHPDGAADVQHRFDKFEIQTDLEGAPRKHPRLHDAGPAGSEPADGGHRR